MSLLGVASAAALVVWGAERQRGADAEAKGREVRGVWIWGQSVSAEGAEATAERLAAHGVNAALLLVKGVSGRVAYPSRLAPRAYPDGDLLRDFLAACQRRHIQTHAWFIFNTDNAYGRAHPSEVMYSAGRSGAWDEGYSPIAPKGDSVGICPASEGYRAYFKELVGEVLQGYPVDGIHLDCIRYPHITYCFCPRHQEKARKRGIKLERVRQALYRTLAAPDRDRTYYFRRYAAGDPDITAWVRMRDEEIAQMVREVRDLVRAKGPNVRLSAAFMPEGAEDDPTTALCHYAQNYETSGALLDFVIPMSYHVSYGQSAAWPAQLAEKAARRAGVPAYAGIQAFPSKAGVDAAAAAQEAVAAVRQQGVPGFFCFRYGTLPAAAWKSVLD
ncbi:MAG: family 10 glycosylhydrolase [Armatimonadota bacterium]|nr:family 10 glycosylhydrolase [Armatimonadota bacterium]